MMDKDYLQGYWKSEYKIEVLSYNSNFSNWTGEMPIPGYFIFEVQYENKDYIGQLKIPVEGSRGEGHYPIIMGRYEQEEKEIKIWQNEEIPVIIKYRKESGKLLLNLYGKEIKFIKE